MSNVFLVARHPIFRAALAQVIRDQCADAVRIVGESDWTHEELAAIAAAAPDVVVVVVGLEVDHELASVSDIRSLAPACRVLAIDTLGALGEFEAWGWAEADALLPPEHLVTELTPAIRGLAGLAHLPPAPCAGTGRRAAQAPQVGGRANSGELV